MIKNKLTDDQYEFKGTPHERIVVRGIVLNEENKIAFCHVVRNDIFGQFDYIETPGGGKENNESIEDGLKREIDEELGLEVEIIAKLGEVDDYYNLISRHNFNHYYLCKIIRKTRPHFVSQGDTLIKDIYWLDLKKAEKMMEECSSGVPLLVARRELPILQETEKYLIHSKI